MAQTVNDYRVHYRTEHSQGHVATKACGGKEAMRAVQDRMPHVKVTRAEKV